jgi:hypothetical protein
MNRTELMTKARASADRLLQEKGYISVVEVLLAMGRLSKENRMVSYVRSQRAPPNKDPDRSTDAGRRAADRSALTICATTRRCGNRVDNFE